MLIYELLQLSVASNDCQYYTLLLCTGEVQRKSIELAT